MSGGKDDRGLTVTPEGVAFSDEALVQGAFEASDLVAYFVVLKMELMKALDPTLPSRMPTDASMNERARRLCQPMLAVVYQSLKEMQTTKPQTTVHEVIANMLEAFRQPKVAQLCADAHQEAEGLPPRTITGDQRLKAITFLKAIRYMETERLAAENAKLRRENLEPLKEPVVHDYRRRTLRWGHNYCVPLVVGHGTTLGWGPIGGTQMKAGDVLLVTGPKDTDLRFRIDVVTYKTDPWDMWEATLSEMS